MLGTWGNGVYVTPRWDSRKPRRTGYAIGYCDNEESSWRDKDGKRPKRGDWVIVLWDDNPTPQLVPWNELKFKEYGGRYGLWTPLP